MALTEMIAAKTAAETSDAVVLTGKTQVQADDLSFVDSLSEVIAIHRERKDGTYEALIMNKKPVVLTVQNPVIVLDLYAGIKAVKPATVETVAVSYVAAA